MGQRMQRQELRAAGYGRRGWNERRQYALYLVAY